MIYIVGIGPGSRDYVTEKAFDTVETSDFVLGSKRSLEIFEINGERVELTVNLKNELYEFLKNYKNSDSKKKVSILSTGDPCFSGLLKTIFSFDFIEQDDFEVVPGISSIQMAAAKAKISWEDYTILTLHGKEENLKKLLDFVKNDEKVIFLPNNLKNDLNYLVENRISTEKEITVLENLSYDNERIITDKISNLLGNNYSYLLVCIIN
ncbi:precorrin-6Y C5,15-methyltransferase (decarboxylating) [Methanococcus maripaludis C5]|uniref:Precorrin-6Y C5,15-methyltransferase (Decarboxylating) n=1 Tax=Methanococcus maripaludis (strain C5 / ATCC BAA-1333) TaxID=402880 RepID=A4FWV1_METM5|nr:cobalt-precorrin-7 (C(5))-methyltransferase [Methanococcus maripaludis]ABO34680.1 precorrin-6Y C5,15-methyltransferase (decarboxylating) [Methanococcus maripaludis C5]